MALGFIYNYGKLVALALSHFEEGPTPADKERRPSYTLNDIPVHLWRKIPQDNVWFFINQVQGAILNPKHKIKDFEGNCVEYLYSMVRRPCPSALRWLASR